MRFLTLAIAALATSALASPAVQAPIDVNHLSTDEINKAGEPVYALSYMDTVMHNVLEMTKLLQNNEAWAAKERRNVGLLRTHVLAYLEDMQIESLWEIERVLSQLAGNYEALAHPEPQAAIQAARETMAQVTI